MAHETFSGSLYIPLILQYSPMIKFLPLSRRTEHSRFLSICLSIDPVLQRIRCSEAKPRLKPVSRGMNMEGSHTLSSAPPLSIVLAFVATHNHFVLDRGGKVFNRSAPIIKLADDATEQDHLGLLALLNSSIACFWM